jgi:hypothetical protein
MISNRDFDFEKNKFWNREKCANFILRDRDSYISSLTPEDLYARSFSDHRAYAEHAAHHHAADFTPEEISILLKSSQKVQSTIRPNLQELLVPCNLARITGTCYESGWPHTREKTIFVTDSFFDSPEETLAHEWTHVFQRSKPLLVSSIFSKLSMPEYIAVGSRSPAYRSNPDLDSFVYSNPRTNQLSGGYRYASDKPKNMSDVVNDRPYEHPFEHMAYAVQALLKKSQSRH